MATKPESKIDAATAQAYAEASAKQTKAKKDEVSVAKADKPVAKKAKKAPVRKKVAAKKPVAKKTTNKKVVRKTPAKKSVKKAAAKKTAAPKHKVAAKKATKSTQKVTIMTKAKNTTADYTAQVKEGLADLQTRAKTAYDKGSEIASDMGEFSKDNLEAVVESGKILAAGVQEIAKAQFEDGKAAVETMTADAKEFAAVKSPTEFVQLQGKIASRNFDATVAQVSKTSEAWIKLANDVFAPISSRASVAMEKVRKAA